MSKINKIFIPAFAQAACLFIAGFFLFSCTNDVVGPDRPPVSRAGLDSSTTVGTKITLDGTGSFDPDGTPIEAYSWTLKSAPEGVGDGILQGADSATPSITPDLPGTYLLSLVVSSGGLDSSPDIVRVMAQGCITDEDCDDLDICNGQESCHDGHCQDGTALDCDDGSECTEDSCDPQSGCIHQNLEDGTVCGEDFCSGANIMEHNCQDGSCSGTSVKQTCEDQNPCTDDTCDSETTQCSYTNNTASCDDGNSCSDMDHCVDGICTAGAVNKDTDEDGFIDAACQGGDDCNDNAPGVNPGAFEGPQNSEICSDGIDNDCDGLTDENDRGCGHCDDDSDCDDGNLCNGTESCAANLCHSGTALNCDDGNECTQNQCDPQTGCVYPALDDGTECGTRSCTGSNNTTWTKQTCVGGECTGSATEQECDDGNDCTADQCDPSSGCTNPGYGDGTECGSRFCSGNLWNEQTCQNGVCSGIQQIENCDAGAECQTYTCEDASGCHSADAEDGIECGSRSCDGTVWKMQTCSGGTCSGEQDVTDCDQGVECIDYACDPNNGCSSSPNTGRVCGTTECISNDTLWVSYTCQDGSCSNVVPEDNCDDSLLCTVDSCDDATGCDHQPASQGTDCETDSIHCTSDVCDDAGNCTHQENNDACPTNGDLCRPACFNDVSGCGAPPGSMDVACDNPVDLDSQTHSDCTLTLAGGGTITGQAPCLDCRAELKVVTLDYADFTDDADESSCSLDGWDLRTGNHCYSDSDQCPMTGNIDAACCSTATCEISGGPYNGEHAFVVNRANCSNVRKWHIRKAFDTRGLTDLELCFDYASRDVTNNEVVQISVNDNAGHFDGNVFCDVEGPRKEINDRWYRQCVDLPSWADENSFVMIHFFLNSNDSNDIIYLDNISLRGLSVDCPATREVVFEEDFSTCDDPLIDWNGWTVQNTISNLHCNEGTWGCPAGESGNKLVVLNSAGSISRTVDLSNYHDVMLCFYYGDDGAAVIENDLLVTYDLGNGNGPKDLWAQSGNAGQNKTCGQICVNLSELNTSINRNPHVTLSFSLAALSHALELDGIVLRASRYCDGDGVITFTSHSSVLPDGQYSIWAEDINTSMQASADFFCSWDTPPEGQEVEDSTSVDYLFPMP